MVCATIFLGEVKESRTAPGIILECWVQEIVYKKMESIRQCEVSP